LRSIKPWGAAFVLLSPGADEFAGFVERPTIVSALSLSGMDGVMDVDVPCESSQTP